MGKFASTLSTTSPAQRGRGPLTTVGRTQTYEGGEGFVKSDKTELFTLAAANFVNEDSFYESAGGKQSRFVRLIHSVTQSDPRWVRQFVPFLRNELQMRSASVVVACEYVKAGGPNGRRVVDSACSRADEPAEVLAYWISQYGRNIPQPVKRGVADASRRLLNQYSALKYDSGSFRLADVINLTHPKPTDAQQAALFKYLLDRRYKGGSAPVPAALEQVRLHVELLDELNSGRRDAVLAQPERLKAAGLTWENVKGTGPMTAKAWEAIIPSMGYMALLRNLRNFEQAGVSKQAVKYVCDRLTDPEQVARSRQFPYRFLTAFKSVSNLQWASALEDALNLSVSNIPTLQGGTLTLVDTSGSMGATLSINSSVQRYQVGAVFGAAFATRNEGDLVSFGNDSGVVPVRKGTSVLTVVRNIRLGEYGHGTAINTAIRRHFDPSKHRRVVVFSDMQTMDSSGTLRTGWGDSGKTPDVPVVYAFDLAGYEASAFDTRVPGRYQLAGFSDKLFTLMPLLERGAKADWPWES